MTKAYDFKIIYFLYSFVVPWGVSRWGHCRCEMCSGRTLSGSARASRCRDGAFRGSFVNSRPLTARNMLISQFVTFAPGYAYSVNKYIFIVLLTALQLYLLYLLGRYSFYTVILRDVSNPKRRSVSQITSSKLFYQNIQINYKKSYLVGWRTGVWY